MGDTERERGKRAQLFTFYHLDYQVMYISKTSAELLRIAVTVMVICGRNHAFAAVIMKM